MKKIIGLLLAAAMLVSGALGCAAQSAPPQWINSTIGSLVTQDTPTDPREDFHLYVNKDWVLETQLDQSETMVSWFSQGQDQVLDQIIPLLEGELSQDHDVRQAQIFYQQYMDMDARNQLGVQPVLPYLEEIQAISTLEELSAYIAKEPQLAALVSWGMTTDLMDSTKNMVGVSLTSLSLGDADEYQQPTNYGLRMKEALTQVVQEALALCGYTQEEAARHVDNMFALETELSGSVYGSSVQKQEDYLQKIYNLYTLEQLEALTPNLPMAQILAKPLAAGAEIFLVMEPDALAKLNQLYTQDNLEKIKSLLICQTVRSAAALLDQRFLDLTDAYVSQMSGVEYRSDLGEMAYSAANGFFEWAIGKLYAQNYGSQEINQRMTQLVEQVVQVYQVRLENNQWLGEETKAMALGKLDSLRVRVGYPQDWTPYEMPQLTLQTAQEGGNLLSNSLLIAAYTRQDALDSLHEAVDKEEWVASPQTVNAYYQPTDNSINLPSAILALAFADGNPSDEQMLGIIGTIVGHEITHGFDTTGSQFDADGNLNNWWTQEDRAAFQELTQQVAQYYGAIEVLPGECVDGQLTIGETVADLGGMSCALEIARGIQDFDYDEFFRSYASLWRLKTTAEMAEMLLTDVHAPNYLRTNVDVQQFEEFYQTYGVEPGDGMYLAPEDRLSVW